MFLDTFCTLRFNLGVYHGVSRRADFACAARFSSFGSTDTLNLFKTSAYTSRGILSGLDGFHSVH